MKRFVEEHPRRFFLLCVAAFAVISYGLFGFFRGGDDTYIYLQFVKHFIHGEGLCFNAGERTYGFTSIVWILILSAFRLVTGNALAASMAASFFWSVALLFVWWMFAQKVTRDLTAVALGTVLFVVDPNLLKHSYLGMETPLSGFLILLAVGLYFREREDGRNLPLSGLVFSLAILNRPESGLVVILVVCDQLIHKLPAAFIARFILLCAAPVIAWGSFAFLYFGTFVPNTVLAKGGSYAPFGRFIANLKDSTSILLPPYAAVFFSLVAFAAGMRHRSKEERRSWWRDHWLMFAIPGALVLSYCALVNNELVYARYMFLFIPLLLYETFTLFTSPIPVFSQRMRRILLAAIAVEFVAIDIATALATRLSYLPAEEAKSENIRWIREHTDPRAIVVTGVLGRYGYETDRKLICPIGLLNPDIIGYIKTTRTLDYYRSRHADYFVILSKSPDDPGDLLRATNARIVHSDPM
ncbi:MAG TPA: hypothetical protein VMM57_11025, partial [Bacteroidota bacterium]|nr:hypothetical protein [Bacteroidota bacterium]